MDYWTFDGYLQLRDYVNRNPGITKKSIFPGIEIRMVAPTNFRLNTHVLFSDAVSTEALGHFISHLKISDLASKPPTRQNVIAVGRSYDSSKLNLYGYKEADKSDDIKMYDAGIKSIVVTRESVNEAIGVVGQEHCLIIQPYDTSDGLEDLDWKRHPFTDSYLMKWADYFETRDPIHVNLFLGLGYPAKPQVARDFLTNLGGAPKPVLSGSDAHSVNDYGKFPSDRATWLKAQPTFKGLQQVCNEPALRCHIGDQPKKLEHVSLNPTKYIKSISFSKTAHSQLDEEWFTGKEVVLNPGLVAVVGNKGSGKSALADIIALAGNSHCPKMEFLNENRFKDVGNKASNFNATISWCDGSTSTIRLDSIADMQRPERVRYLPQHFIETLCNEIAAGNETNFGKELKKVIFTHVPTEKQLGKPTLDELIEYLVEARRKAFQAAQQVLRTTNENIVKCELDSSKETISSYETALALKEIELESIDKVPLEKVEQPKEDPNDTKTANVVKSIDDKSAELELLKDKILEARTKQAEFTTRQAIINRLLSHILNFESFHTTFISDHADEFKNAGYPLENIISVTTTKSQLTADLAYVTTRMAEIELELNGAPDAPGSGLEASKIQSEQTIQKLQDQLQAPHRAYQAYKKQLESREAKKVEIQGAVDKVDTIEYFKNRIKNAREVIPAQLIELRKQRQEVVIRLHTELLAIRKSYEEMYQPVQKIAQGTASALQLEFNASIIATGFESNFFDYIHRGRKGTFYGDEESKAVLRGILRSHDFNKTNSVVEFTDSIMNALTGVAHGDNREELSISSQLRDKKKLNALYDFIFGLEYLDVQYTLKLGGKDISQLSPGEKGGLLLVFYLMLDVEEIPIIIDQPEHNLDNESVVRLLVDCIRNARSRRQVIIVTHNPNLAVYCDADQVICCTIDKPNKNKIDYITGAIEEYEVNRFAVNVLEGTYPAFDNRRRKWHKPT